MKPAVVVNAFNRPESLDRLLRTLRLCDTRDGTDLVISVDGGGSRRREVLAVAKTFAWTAGASKVIEQDDLGLVAHFRACGDLVEELGPIVLLEDDLVVGPNALRFAEAALDFTDGDDKVAGVSLSVPWFDGFRHLRFEPLLDGSDAIYAKLPWFHGMAWTQRQWRRHRVGAAADSDTSLPGAFSELGNNEWFPDAVRDLVADDSWYLLSRAAHAVNFGDAGTHFTSGTEFFQQPIMGGRFEAPRFLGRDDPAVVPYDEYLEPDGRWLANHVDVLVGLDVSLDLRGVRQPDAVTTEWVVTSRPSTVPVGQWGSVMHPLEQNLISDVPGTDLTLCLTQHMSTGPTADRAAEQTVFGHGHHGRPPGVRGAMRRAVLRALDRRSDER